MNRAVIILSIFIVSLNDLSAQKLSTEAVSYGVISKQIENKSIPYFERALLNSKYPLLEADKSLLINYTENNLPTYPSESVIITGIDNSVLMRHYLP